MQLSTWDCSVTERILNIHQSACSAVLIATWLVPRETSAISAQGLCTPYNHTPVYSVTIRSHFSRVYVCLAVTCHLHFWQNDRDLLRATTVTRGWNGCRNKSQYRKLPRRKTNKQTTNKKTLLRLEPETFRLRVRRSNHWAIRAPRRYFRNPPILGGLHAL